MSEISGEQSNEPIEIINEPKEPLDEVELNVKKVIQDIHDNYHPQIYFLTATNAVGAGYTIREIYKKAYPNEPMPKFLFIDVSLARSEVVMEAAMGHEEDENDSFKKAVEETRKKLSRYNKDENISNGNIAVIDEYGAKGQGHSLATAEMAIKKAMDDSGFKGEVVGGGFGDYQRRFYAYLMRGKQAGEDFYKIRMVNNKMIKNPWEWEKNLPPMTERERARKNIKYLKELGIKIGEMIKKEEQEKVIKQ